ncbi:hypothetical protein AB0L57_21575 [Nocardia sp. NPDC052254]|uniref:hypothetical protein n=1 Tax=Nocardia sp. NPDC052254 TaxID=3155681 RepID=UPI0034456932
MGDFFERIVDVEVEQDEAGPLARDLVDWLVAEGILTRELSGDGVYSMQTDQGYLPGPNWATVVDGPGWEPGPVAVIVGRSSHCAGQGFVEAEYAACPHCDTRVVIFGHPQLEPDAQLWAPFSRAIDEWERTGTATVHCASCDRDGPLREWEWDDGFALGSLALDFWGWAPLRDDFAERIQRRLGHRIARHSGKF